MYQRHQDVSYVCSPFVSARNLQQDFAVTLPVNDRSSPIGSSLGHCGERGRVLRAPGSIPRDFAVAKIREGNDDRKTHDEGG